MLDRFKRQKYMKITILTQFKMILD